MKMESETKDDVRLRHSTAKTSRNCPSDETERSDLPNLTHIQDTDSFECARKQNRQYETAQDYADALRSWMWQYHNYQIWNCMSQNAAMLPLYAAMCSQTTNAANLTNGISPSVSQTRVPPDGLPNANSSLRGNSTVQGTEYRVPPLWKRLVAELIDFLLLFVIKLSVTLVAVEYFGLIDVEHFDFDYMLLKGELDYEKAMSLSSEIIVMEVVNRIFVTIFEALCLRKGVGGSPGGSTPGKRVMGLKVVSCIDVVTLNNGKLYVIPARNIGFLNSLARSVVKNFSIAFFFPVCFTVMFFQHGRAAYDVISTSIVVEIN